MSYPEWIRDEARALHMQGMKPPTIAKELQRRFPDEELPDERTVRIWRSRWETDQSGPWQLSGKGDPATLLPVLRVLIEETRGKVRTVTNLEAEELSRLAPAAPDMPALGMLNWARGMIEARAARAPVDPLIHYLCFRPWQDGGRSYLAAADAGWIKELRSFCPSDEGWLPINSRQKRGSFGAQAVIRGRSGGAGSV
jgi:hypothetical protein